ncbi:amidohydrolase family protein [Planobispora longispora]|uniref:Amidohydrolase n=1 Tax=Planobispora longispora TaxID=28887 RepID=A0A8J3W297_9ACTN|nr:amidohydrolase family protein [Planobispora longispora]GIH73577.1 amidohydrolase [Planobispora longispora]
MLIRDVEVRGRRTDVRLAAGRVGEIGSLSPRLREEVLDGGGGVLLPGLTDHHVHLHAWAAAMSSVTCGPPAVRNEQDLREVLARAVPDAAGWIRGVGCTWSLDAGALDQLHPHRPVRLQHRGGSLWMLNTVAIKLLGLDHQDDPSIEKAADGSPTGRLWRGDHLLGRLRRPPDLSPVAAMLARWGITAVTDATPGLDEVSVLQRVLLLGSSRGSAPRKIVIRDDALPSLGDLIADIAAAHANRRPVAMHCLTTEALLLALAALDEAGSLDGDRLEHAAVVPAWGIERIHAHGLRVVTQPGFLADRGEEMARDTAPGDLYRYGSLLKAGVMTVPSSDAPYGPADPWQVMAAARDRVIGRRERVSVRVALDGYLTPGHLPRSGPAEVRPGAAGDLVLLEDSLRDLLEEPDAGRVRNTIIGGRIVY